MKESNLFCLSQLLGKVSSKLDTIRKVTEGVLLGQKTFPNRDFQSEASTTSNISTDAAGKFIALRYVSD